MQHTAIQSAETLATLRAIASSDASLATPCRDALARYFLSRKNRVLLDLLPHRLLKGALQRFAPGSYEFAVARTRHFDETLLERVRQGAEQVVILGAGYDSRALRFEEELAGTRVFELDHPGTQARKIELLKQAPGDLPENLTLIAIDFARQAFGAALLERGFRPDRKTLFLWEGVSYYLPPAAVGEVLAFAGRCARGSSIVFDYATASFVQGDTSTYGGRQMARWLKRIGEPFLFGLDPLVAPAYLARYNLHAVSHLGPADLGRLYLATADGHPPSKMLGHVSIIEGRSPGTASVSGSGDSL